MKAALIQIAASRKIGVYVYRELIGGHSLSGSIISVDLFIEPLPLLNIHS